MYFRDKHKTVLFIFLVSAVLIVAAALLIMLFVFDTERAQKEQIGEFERMGILSEDDSYEFNDTLPQIPDTSWIDELQLQEQAVQAPLENAQSHKGIADAEMYHDTTRNEPSINIVEEDAIAMSDAVNYNTGTYFELPE